MRPGTGIIYKDHQGHSGSSEYIKGIKALVQMDRICAKCTLSSINIEFQIKRREGLWTLSYTDYQLQNFISDLFYTSPVPAIVTNSKSVIFGDLPVTVQKLYLHGFKA